jgi:hypothetical protein
MKQLSEVRSGTQIDTSVEVSLLHGLEPGFSAERVPENENPLFYFARQLFHQGGGPVEPGSGPRHQVN